jgi:methyltransferase (TIGR00027 family)
MRNNQTSMTAMGIAVLRAVESARPEDERICFDPYARRFLPGWFYSMTQFFINTGYAEWRGPGVTGFLVARERFIDDYLANCLKEGLDQLVILGTGYDARPYRFTELQKNVHVFEVDHPATQQAKLKVVQKVFGSLPGNVSYVAIDFNQQALADRLNEYGYDQKAKTTFIWQGVTYYLEATAIDETLAFIAQNSARGSSVIFDYIDEALLKNPSGHGEVKGMKRYRGMTGEELKFGIPVAQIESFLNQRGFGGVQNIRSEDLKALYFHGKNQARNVMSGYAIVSALVN